MRFPSLTPRLSHFGVLRRLAISLSLAGVVVGAIVAVVGTSSVSQSQDHDKTPGRVFPNAESTEPIAVGAVVPDATVRTIDGESVQLTKRIGESGALLVFYRGGW